jgi:hypothetical protein
MPEYDKKDTKKHFPMGSCVPWGGRCFVGSDLYNLVGDYRLYKYPQITFGLGSDSWIGTQDPMDYRCARFYELVMRRIVRDLCAGAGYIIDYHWGITDESGSKIFRRTASVLTKATGFR